MTLTPWKRPRVADPAAKRGFCVHTDYGAPKTRFIQGIADKVGGLVVYFEAWRPGKDAPTQCIPVTEFRGTGANGGGASEGNLMNAADFVDAALSRGYAVTAVGPSRVRYEISVKCTGGSRDDATEAAAAANRPAVVAEGALRSDF